MSTFLSVIDYLLYAYSLLLIARVVIEVIRQFARSWRPVGVAAIGVEIVYISTDPPVRALRRLIPPLRLGGISLDLSVLILLLAIVLLRVGVESLADHVA